MGASVRYEYKAKKTSKLRSGAYHFNDKLLAIASRAVCTLLRFLMK
jgi:hypothetical protein